MPSFDPERGHAGDGSPAAPRIPSFDSLRSPRHRTAVDVLTPAPPAAPEEAAVPPARAPRPAEYADLLRLGLRIASAVAGVPVRLARWSVREPGRCVRRLLGDQSSAVRR